IVSPRAGRLNVKDHFTLTVCQSGRSNNTKAPRCVLGEIGHQPKGGRMPGSNVREIKSALVLLLLVFALSFATVAFTAQEGGPPPPVVITAQQDHQRIMELLKITSLRQGADGRNADAPNAANYDEAKANPFPKLPDALVLKSGKKVTTAKM